MDQNNIQPKKWKYVLVLLASIAIAACSGGGDDSGGSDNGDGGGAVGGGNDGGGVDGGDVGGGDGNDGDGDDDIIVIPENPSLTIQKYVNGELIDAAPGPEIGLGSIAEWRFDVTNTGNVALSDVQITDTTQQPITLDAVFICELDLLGVDETQSCDSSHAIVEGQHQSEARAEALSPEGVSVNATAESFYVGFDPNLLAALPVVNRSSGNAPLSVTFIPNANTGNAISTYEWDFEGDGVYDRSETVGRDQSFTYLLPGQYEATLRVTDNEGEQAVGTVTINVGNEPPSVFVFLVPSNGQIPLSVSFSAIANDNNGIAQFEWDYDGDGTFDEVTDTGFTLRTYEDVGSFQARVRVTDVLGASTTLDIPTLEVAALPEGSPSVFLDASVDIGNPPLEVEFIADVDDPNDEEITEYAWDFDGDGTFDQTSTSNTISNTYTAVGQIFPRVRVTNSAGLTAEDAAEIFVEPEFSLSIDTDTIEPAIGESVIITTELNGDIDMSIVIEDQTGQQVRSLVPFATRLAGSYQDSWDGQNDSGQTVTEGVYRAVMLYRVEGVVERLDLATTTGGVQSNPDRSTIPRSFAPFADDPLDITFELEQASEVTAFMGLFNVNTRLITFLQRQPLGRGTHQITWNGENTDGQLIEAPPGDSFLFGIFAYTLPDNAIFVRSGVHINSVNAEPSIYQPVQRSESTELNPGLSQIEIEMSRAGNARVLINDAETGITVADYTVSDLPAGFNTLTWDGKDHTGEFVAPGAYRIGVSGIDENGYESIRVFTLQRVFY